MPTQAHDASKDKTFVGLPGKNIKLAHTNANRPSAAAATASPSRPAPLNTTGRSRSKSPLGITVDTSVGRNGATPQLLKAASSTSEQKDQKRRSSMLLIPTFGSDKSRVSRRKDAPAALQLDTALSPSDRLVPLVLSAITPEFLRLNSKHGRNNVHAPLHPNTATAGMQSAPPIIIVTPTENTPPLSPPRRTQTAPSKPPRSSSIYTRNTKLFTAFQTPRVGLGTTPALPKTNGRFRLTSFSPMSLMSGSTIFEDESPIDPAMHTTSPLQTRRNTDFSFESVMATPLRNNGWWDILSPISPQALIRSFTAPARIGCNDTSEEVHTPLLEGVEASDQDRSRDIRHSQVYETTRGNAGASPSKLLPSRIATQRSVPEFGEAAEYYDPSKDFNVEHNSQSRDETRAHAGTKQDPDPNATIPQADQCDGIRKGTSVTNARERTEDNGATSKSTKVSSSQRQPAGLRSAFETPKPFSQTPQAASRSFPETPPKLPSSRIDSEEPLAHYHHSNATQTQRLEMPSAERHIALQQTGMVRPEMEANEQMYYRGFSGTYGTDKSPSADYDYENAYSAPSPRTVPVQQTSPRIRHLHDPESGAEVFPGHEKAIAMGMDKPANYDMQDSDAPAWDEKSAVRRNVQRDVESGRDRPPRQPWRVWFKAPRFVGDKDRMSKRGKWLLIAISASLLIVIVLSVALAMTLSQKPTDMPVGIQWANVTNMPAIPTGISTIASPHEKVASSCIANQDAWSCSMPKEQQALSSNADPQLPNFRIEVRYLASLDKAANKHQRHDAFDEVLAQAAPAPPSINDRAFLGNTTDQVQPIEGEQTPFVMSLLPLTPVNASNTTHSNTKRGIPAAPLAVNKTAAPALLYPEVSAQPLYLYNRGLRSEHYAFSSYFAKSIFLSLPNGTASLNGTIPSPSFNTSNSVSAQGGAPRTLANTYCVWPQTRLHVQLWTQPNGNQVVNSSAVGRNGSASAIDFTAPGSMPLPMTIELDRHGGSAGAKGVVCWDMDSQGKVDDASRVVVPEDRGSDGHLVNAAPAPFEDVQLARMGGWGGVDGGTGGCGCSWTNW